MAAVSVIMPAYNVEAYIGAAIESVRGQTMSDWELLVADDGSTDGTAAVVRGHAAADPRVRLLQQPNRGVSSARNRALRASTGELLAVLDSDDLWEPAYLAAQVAILRQRPDIDIVTGNGWFLGDVRHGTPVNPWPDPRPDPSLIEILGDDRAVFIMSVIRRRVYDTIGGFDEGLQTSEDYEFWLRAALDGFRFARNDEPLGHYRRRSGGASADVVTMLTGILAVLGKLRPILADRPAELRVLERQIARFEGDRLAELARAALDSGRTREAAGHLAALHAHGGGAVVRLASVMAKWTPGLFSRAYQFRRAHRETAS